MRAVVLEEAGREPRLTARSLPAPSVGDYDVMVQVAACGFCHHDLLVMEGVLRRGVKLPLILGHEAAGQVAEVGPRVSAVEPGDRVVCLLTNSPCERCVWCLRGQERFCVEVRGLGHGINGGMAEFVSVRETSLVKVPSSIEWTDACLLACPIGVAVQGLEKAKIQAGETVVVTGAGGGLGVHLAQLARTRGARVLAVTSSEEKVESLKALGAEEVITTGELDFSEVVLALTEDRGAEVALDTVGSPLFASTLRSMARGGRIVLLGEVQGGATSLNLAELIFRDLRIMGSVGATRRHVEEACRLVAGGEIRPVVAQALPWDQVMEAYRLLKGRQAFGRVVLDFASAW